MRGLFHERRGMSVEKMEQAVLQRLKENAEGEEFVEYLDGLLSFGMSAGISGFIYYHETGTFYDEWEEEIWECLEELADRYGYDGVLSLIDAAYPCANEGLAQFKNAAVWLVVYDVASKEYDKLIGGE